MTDADATAVRQELKNCLSQIIPGGSFLNSLHMLHSLGEPVDTKTSVRRSLARFRRVAQQGSMPGTRQVRRPDGSWREAPARVLDPVLDVDALTAGDGPTGPSQPSLANAGFLSLAVFWNDHDSLRWAMRCGLNPNRFDRSAGSTPVGQAAYGGNIEAVRLFWSAGADVLLTVTGEFGEDARYHGSTLLHRLLEPGRKCPPGTGDVAAFLIDTYPNPLIEDAQGRTFLDWAGARTLDQRVASAQAREALAARQAREQEQALKETLPRGNSCSPARIRL